jgi:hypothetical protein
MGISIKSLKDQLHLSLVHKLFQNQHPTHFSMRGGNLMFVLLNIGNEADPLDFLSRYPLPEKENDGTERVIKAVIHNEHAVVVLLNIGMRGLCAVIILNFGAPRR